MNRLKYEREQSGLATSTAPLPPVFRLCSCIARLLYFEGISYGFCDAYCRGHTGSRPERAVGSLLASLSGKVPGTARDCDLSCLPSIQNMLNHFGLVPGSLGNRWKKALGSWLGLLPQHVTGMSSILRCSRSYFNRFSLFAHRLYRQVPCQTPQSHELCNPYGFSHAQVSNRPLPILPFTAILNVAIKEQPDVTSRQSNSFALVCNWLIVTSIFPGHSLLAHEQNCR